MLHRRAALACIVACLIGSGCGIIRPIAKPTEVALADEAKRRLGDTELKLGPREYAFDSVGFARLVYQANGVDLFYTDAVRDGRKHGVEIVYQYMALNGELDMGRVPRRGDLVFLSQTRDANHDGRPDALSQVGVVIDVDDEGTATILTTLQTRVGVLHMNRLYPDSAVTPSGKPANSSLLLPTTRKSAPVSSLFHSFGRLKR